MNKFIVTKDKNGNNVYLDSFICFDDGYVSIFQVKYKEEGLHFFLDLTYLSSRCGFGLEDIKKCGFILNRSHEDIEEKINKVKKEKSLLRAQKDLLYKEFEAADMRLESKITEIEEMFSNQILQIYNEGGKE